MTTSTESEIEQLRRELAEVRANQTLQPSDSLAMAIAEVRAQYEAPVENGKMTGPCQHEFPDGRMCGLRWKTNGEVTHPTDHSYREKPLVRKERSPGFYAAEKAQKNYVDPQEAADILGITLEEVSASSLPKVSVAGHDFYRREEVDELSVMLAALKG